MGTTVSSMTERVDISPLPPENPGSSLIDYDPDRQIYFNSELVFLDCYVGASVSFFTMPIYSKTYIDPADISVTFPVDVPIGVEVTQVMGIEGKTEFTDSEDDLPENVMPYYVYQAYRGGHVQALADARQAEMGLAFIADKTKDGPLWADFEKLTASDLPQFYVYTVRVDLSKVPAPPKTTTWTLEKMDITINGETYEAKLGRVRLYNLEDFPWKGNTGIIPESCGVYTENLSELYGDGIAKLPRVCVIDHMEQDYGTIGAVWMLDKDSRILAAKIIIEDAGGNYRTANVSSSEPELFFRNESVYVDVIIKNENADKLLNSIQYQLVVEMTGDDYSKEDENSDAYDECVARCKMYTFNSSTYTGHYENYAIIFDGVDMEPYYDYYHENYQVWRKDYLN